MIEPPQSRYQELFEAVQRGGLFADSKHFADAMPLRPPAEILSDYRRLSAAPEFSLRGFVDENFRFASAPRERLPCPDADPVRQIDTLWRQLTRPSDERDGSSLIPLPGPYVVPGGRFRELYYWDSYFTLLGLAASGRWELVASMVDNFAWLIDRVGHVPNGNRSYYCSRSQPPFFALMVELLAEHNDDRGVYTRYRPHLEAEYRFWMSGADALGEEVVSQRRVVTIGEDVVNRYWDDLDTPRDESYREDLATAAAAGADPHALYREIRAACETGWDFSSRWLSDAGNAASLRTTRIVPVDLNCLLHELERVLSVACGAAGDVPAEARYRELAQRRADSIRNRFFDDVGGQFVDLLLPGGTAGPMCSLAMVYPLYTGIATAAQAEQTAAILQRDYLRPGGWVTTTRYTEFQWDAPSGWAPLQWLTFKGLLRYGFQDLAYRGAQAWVDNCLETYRATGLFMERYDVDHPGRLPAGGEYPTQSGFGWTNGVLLQMIHALSR